MSLIIKYKEDLNKYIILRNKMQSIVMELSLAIDNASNVSNEIKSKYLINDNYTPIGTKCDNAKSNLETIYDTLNNKVIVYIDLNIKRLKTIIERLEREQQNNEQDIVWNGWVNMAISYMNTDEVENISKEIISLANEMDSEIINLFTRFSEVPSVTKEWVGSQSEVYFDKIALDKKQYIDFANTLKDIGYKLSSDAYELKVCMNKNINTESRKER